MEVLPLVGTYPLLNALPLLLSPHQSTTARLDACVRVVDDDEGQEGGRSRERQSSIVTSDRQKRRAKTDELPRKEELIEPSDE